MRRFCTVFPPIHRFLIDFSTSSACFDTFCAHLSPILAAIWTESSGEEWVSLSTELPSEESTDSGDVELLENLEELYSGSIPDIAACIEGAPCASRLRWRRCWSTTAS